MFKGFSKVHFLIAVSAILFISSLVSSVVYAKKTVSPTLHAVPAPTCAPRPACLDATPRCYPPVPKAGWCPVPTPTCAPRPACLDATPRCYPPVPKAGWCPVPTPKPRH